MGDEGVVAFERGNGARLGSAWYRLMPEEEPGYGFVSPSVPEVSIEVVPESRGQGVGGALLEELAERAKTDGFDTLGLSVEDGNTAIRLYESHGFVKLFRVENGWTMKTDLS